MLRNRRTIVFLLISLLLHLVGSWQVLRWMTQAEHRQREQLLTRLASQVMDVVYLTEPANQIRPRHATKWGREDHATTEETVARHRPLPMAKSPAVAPRAPSHDTAARPLHAPRLPATAIVRQLDGGLTAHLPEDYFPNYKHGAHTYVNVWRHPDVGYFVEIKQMVGTAWNPLPVAHAHLPVLSRQGALKTVLGITIDREGNLEEKFVLKSSGVAAFDAEALRAFTMSAPFFAPPDELLAIDGLADDRLHLSVSFHVYL